jgi:hypothetical protein
MKEKLRENFNILRNFLMNIKSVELNPYSKGIDTVKFIDDISRFVDDLEKILDEDAAAEILAEKPEEKTTEEAVAEESEKAE